MTSLPAKALMGAVRGYRLILSSWLGNNCRFEPTCSAYALGALERYGAFVGTLLTAGRIGRCAPWCDGGHDPVPAHPLPIFTSLLARFSRPGIEPSPESTESSSS